MNDTKIWTFLVTGGNSFVLEVVGGPKLNHNGKRTMWKMMGTEMQANNIENTIGTFGACVKKYTESQTEDQILIRKARLGNFPFPLEVEHE